MVLTAADPQAAALWLVHRSLDSIVSAYDDPNLTPEDRCEIAFLHGLKSLGNQIEISQQGFGRSDCQKIDLLKIIEVWHQLMTAMLKFESDHNLRN